MEVVLFKIRRRPDIDLEEYERTFGEMLEIVSQMPGFKGIEGYAGEDGSELAVATFDSPEAIAAWRDEPEHTRTQERGRQEFFSAYDITIATVWRSYSWPPEDEPDAP